MTDYYDYFLDVSTFPFETVKPMFFISLGILLGGYLFIRTFFMSNKDRVPKKLAWILSIICSSIMTAGGIARLYELVTVKNMTWDMTWLESSDETSTFVAVFMFTFLICDIVVGLIEYPDQIEMLTGWIHHIVYIFISYMTIKHEFTMIFQLMLIEELPTFIMAIGRFNSKFRSDYLFGISFILVRCLLHGLGTALFVVSF